MGAVKQSSQRSYSSVQYVPDGFLLHNNTRHRSAALVVSKLEEMHWIRLNHSSYSLDLSSCHFHLFGLLKETRRTMI